MCMSKNVELIITDSYFKVFDILTDFTQKARAMKMKYCNGIQSFPAGANETSRKKKIPNVP